MNYLLLGLNAGLLYLNNKEFIKENLLKNIPDFSILFRKNILFPDEIENFIEWHLYSQYYKEKHYQVIKELEKKIRDNKIKKIRTIINNTKLNKKVLLIELQTKIRKTKLLKELKEKVDLFDNIKYKYKKYLENNNCVILNLELFYNYLKDEWKDAPLIKKIVYHSILNKIPVILIGEKNPNTFIPKLNSILNVHFTNNNYISPFHYSQRFLDVPKKLPEGKVNKKPCVVSLKQMIDDIIDEYQLELPYKLILEDKDLIQI